MFWIGTGSILIIFFSVRAFLNNQKRWKKRTLSHQTSKLYHLLMQGGNILLIVAGVLFFMLAIVCHVKGFQLHFSSEYAYHMKLIAS